MEDNGVFYWCYYLICYLFHISYLQCFNDLLRTILAVTAVEYAALYFYYYGRLSLSFRIPNGYDNMSYNNIHRKTFNHIIGDLIFQVPACGSCYLGSLCLASYIFAIMVMPIIVPQLMIVHNVFVYLLSMNNLYELGFLQLGNYVGSSALLHYGVLSIDLCWRVFIRALYHVTCYRSFIYIYLIIFTMQMDIYH